MGGFLKIFVNFLDGFLLVVPRGFLLLLRLFADGSLVQLFPIHFGVFEFEESHPVEFRVLVFEGVERLLVEPLFRGV